MIQEKKCRKHLPKDDNNDIYKQYDVGNKSQKAERKPGTAASILMKQQSMKSKPTVVPMSLDTYGVESPMDSNESFSLSGINDNSDENSVEEDIVEESRESEEMSVLVSESNFEESQVESEVEASESKQEDEQDEKEDEEEEKKEDESEKSVDKDMDYGFMIKYAKDELNMSLSFMAEEMDIDVDRLQQIEDGEIEPEPEEADRLLTVLNKF